MRFPDGFKVALILFWVVRCESYNILGVFPMPGISHQILCTKLMKGLLKAGHDVTIVSPFPVKDVPRGGGKLTEIVITEIAEIFKESMGKFNLFDMNKDGMIAQMKVMTEMFVQYSNITLHNAGLREALKTRKFDAVVTEQFMMDGLKVLTHLTDSPMITLSSLGPNSWVNPTVGNPQPVSYMPHMLGGDFSDDITFLKRAQNLFAYMLDYFINRWYMFPKQAEVVRQIAADAPTFEELYTNVSLVLLNSHTSLYPALPLVPNMVEVGGYFIDPPKQLPPDLREYLDGARDGLIYFSMGSNLKSKDMPAERKRLILNVLGRLKEKVLWKFEEDLPGKPSNVMIRPWLPQQDILAHPNVKLFITHGGLLSTTETVYHGVPVLAIPVFGDQAMNADRAVAGGFALKLAYDDEAGFTEENLYDSIQELVTNPKYRENVKRRSKIYHDRPMKPMETAVYWVEYVIRHKGAPHLRVAGIGQYWYEYFMVDVMGVILLAVLLVVYLVRTVCKMLMCKARPKKVKIN